MRVFKIFYSWQSDLPGNKTRYFIKDCIDDAIELALSCEAIEAQRDEATQGTTGSPNIVTTLFSKIDDCDLFVADLSLCFTKDQGEKRSPNPNVMLELGYAVKTLGWERIICICNTDYGNNYPFDIAQQRITPFSLEEKNRAEVKAQIARIIFINIRDLRGGLLGVKFGMAAHIVGAYDPQKHEVVSKLIPECLNEKKEYRRRNEAILQEAKVLLNEIQQMSIRETKKEVEDNIVAQLTTTTNPTPQIDFSDFMQKINVSLQVSETPVIISDKELIEKDIEYWLKTQVTDSFFDLGNLRNRKSILSNGEPTLQGTDEEKKKYKRICDLSNKLFQLDVRKEYLKTFDDLCFVPVAIKNTSSKQDTNINVVLKIDIGVPVNPSQNLIADKLEGFQGRLCRDDGKSDIGIISELFGLQEDGVIHLEGGYYSALPRTRFPYITPQGIAYPCKDEKDYEAELEESIASTNGDDFYDFEVSSLRPNEIRWLGSGMLIQPCNGIIRISYSIHSDHSDGYLHGTLSME